MCSCVWSLPKIPSPPTHHPLTIQPLKNSLHPPQQTTTQVQSFDQTFENMNKALKLSCLKGLPVRVVRSFKEKRSAYAPSDDTPVRYDGVYRIVRCWRKPGTQGPLVCRYLFVRCDNEPAPWSSEDTGDRPSAGAQLPAEALEEMKLADRGQVFSMCDKPWWGWLEDKEVG